MIGFSFFEPRRQIFAGLLSVAVFAIAACSVDPAAPTANAPLGVVTARNTTADVVVSSAAPDSASQDTTLDVIIGGSGFVSGAVATWAYAGVADPAQIRTNSTRYVNARQLVANITISAGATVAKWDVAVTAGGKGGIGTELFAVKGKAEPNPTTTWMIPLASTGLGLISDNRQPDASGTFSVYASGVCAVSGTIFVGGSGDATVQTNNPSRRSSVCQTARTMTVVYPVGDLAYPVGGTETMVVFMNIHNISNATTVIAVGPMNRVLRHLALNPSQKERCDAWRWNNDNGPGDKVWVERLDATRYHIYTKDRDPDPVKAAAAVGQNRAFCTTTGQSHNLPVDLYVVSNVALP